MRELLREAIKAYHTLEISESTKLRVNGLLFLILTMN